MQDLKAIGMYGKLPAHGDFISRELSASFIRVWDEWLQGIIANSQEQLGENWQSIYLTSPIWRFVLSRGVIDENAWAGIILPSVDKIGRYFPFSIVTRLDPHDNIVDVLSTQASWYSSVEDVALKGLEDSLDAESLFQQLQELTMLEYLSDYIANQDTYNKDETSNLQKHTNIAINMDFEEQLPSSTNSMLLNWFIAQQLPSYSLWHCTGSELVPPSFLVSHGLPAIKGAAAMLEGKWTQWNWQMPFTLTQPDERLDDDSF